MIPSSPPRPLPDVAPTSLVPSAGLQWMAVAHLSELAHTKALGPELSLLFPAARLDAFKRSSGVDLRAAPVALAAGFPYGTLFVVETPADNAPIEAKFAERLVEGVHREAPRKDLHVVSGVAGATPETLVRLDGRFVAVAVGDPALARAVEFFALGRLRAPSALKGAALAGMPPTLEGAPVCFYAPGPFTDEWASGARGLLGATVGVGIGIWPDGKALHVRAMLTGDWSDEDGARLGAAWGDLAESSMGRLFGLDQPSAPPEVSVSPHLLTLDMHLQASPLATGLHAAVAADVWEILQDSAGKGNGPGPR